MFCPELAWVPYDHSATKKVDPKDNQPYYFINESEKSTRKESEDDTSIRTSR